MLFNSPKFIVFFLIVFISYHLIKDYRKQNYLLLISSYFFYSVWDYRFLSLIFINTFVHFLAGKKIAANSNRGVRKIWLFFSLAQSFSILGFFKYYNFGIDSFQQILTWLGFQANFYTLQIILPIGISFYTFQTISYTVDVYREETKPADNFWDFSLYVAFFPQLVAGPIERSVNLLPQFTKPRIIQLGGY